MSQHNLLLRLNFSKFHIINLEDFIKVFSFIQHYTEIWISVIFKVNKISELDIVTKSAKINNQIVLWWDKCFIFVLNA